MSSDQLVNPFPRHLVDKYDPKFVNYYDEHIATRLATHQVSLSEVRANPQRWARQWARDLDAGVDPRTKEWTVTAVGIGTTSSTFKVKTYHPDPVRFGPGPYPAHINFHGGGWIFGDLSSDAAICMRLQNQIALVIIDVDYHLCPEAYFGQNAQDAWDALVWTRNNANMLNINPSSISIGGISAGAHLACIVQHRARDENIELKLLIAAVPPLADHDMYTRPSDSPWPSFSEYSEAPMLDWKRIKYMSDHAFPESRKESIRKTIPSWWISPLRAPNFSNLCDTFLATAEGDLLRDEGENYGQKLIEAGNKVTMRRYPKVPHSFMQMYSVLPQAIQYHNDVVGALQFAHGLKSI